jgi:HEAT repeat protein
MPMLPLIITASFVLTGLVSGLVLVLIALKAAHLLWEADSRRLKRWMKPLLEEALRRKDAAAPPGFRRVSPVQRRVLQYVLLRRSFGQEGDAAKRIAGYYEELGFVDRDLRRLAGFFWWTRAEGARCLGQARCRRAKRALLEKLRDPVMEVRLAAAWALGRIGDADVIVPSLEALVSLSRLAGLRLSATVFEMGEKAVDPLIQALPHPDRAVRLLTVHLLGEMGHRRAVPAILQRTHPEEEREVRLAAFKALGTLGDARALRPLIEALEDPQWEVRAQAARSLGLLRNPEAVPVLAKTLADPKWWVRRNAGEALAQLGKAGADALARAYQSPSGPAQSMAAQWLDELGLLPQSL